MPNVSVAKKQEAASRVLAQIAAGVAEKIEADQPVHDDGKLHMKNAQGEMLMCKLTLAKRAGAPDPLCITINEEFRWVKRGSEVVVPWYVVQHLKNNVETVFRQEKNEQGRSIVVTDQVQAEPFSYTPINPAADCPL